ncbi:NAD(P)-binding protein [Martensiomyces pterosporus]|nr:NAD(P)-binding protein [Martensiomyces pterosporus]
MSSVIVYGGRGALGAAIVRYFKQQSWKVISVDLLENPEADHSVTVSPGQDLSAQGHEVAQGISPLLDGAKVDAVLCVAGGWQGGNAASASFLKSADQSIQQSINTSLIATSLAANHLRQGGLLALTGAVPALGGTPGMIGYGMAKAAVHHLVSSLAAQDSGVDGRVVGILPVTLDTPQNRAGMPGADFSSWTPLEEVAELLYKWSSGQAACDSGRLYKIVTENSLTKVE